MVKAGRLSDSDAKLIQVSARQLLTQGQSQHALEVIAAAAATDQQQPSRTLDLEVVSEWVATLSGRPFFRIDPLKIDTQAVTRVMSSEFAKRHHILALAVEPSLIQVVSSEPYVEDWIELIEQSQPGKRIVHLMASPREIQRYTTEFYAVAQSVKKASAQGLALNALGNLEQLVQLGQLDKMEANDTHIVNIVDWLLQYAFTQRVSDIHIEPRRDKGAVRFRIDGVLHTVYEMPMPVVTAVVSRIKTLGRINVAEKRRPHDGRLKTKAENATEVELRLSTLPTAHGEKMVMRIFDPSIVLKNFASLGLVDRDLKRWQNLFAQPNGIVLVTGPTGSGKTTTLYTSLKQLATEAVNVCTIEDPIEMVEGSFNQMQVQPNIDQTLRKASGRC